MFEELPSKELLAKANSLHKAINGDKNLARMVDQTVEECAELLAAMMQLRRGRGDTPKIIEEVADVMICLDAVLDEISSKREFNKTFTAKVRKYAKNMAKKRVESKKRRGKTLAKKIEDGTISYAPDAAFVPDDLDLEPGPTGQ